ncbi:MAG: HPP family protein [gamma proteobacterium symbiont of Taylorina sp.]|nr:HPP family protein [gamma proteobacterium symbiont of Taylorina sp.]
MQYRFSQLAGIQRDTTQHKEKIISAIGGFVSILFILLITLSFVEMNSAGLIVASMGASAVLLFAVPHGPLSQPWPVAGGHLLSAFVGISCYLLIPNILLAASMAVGLSIAVMYYCRCIHPPGGATALSAVVGGAEVHALAYEYLLTPVLLNVVVILLVAIVFNYAFSWRRYPAVLAVQLKPKDESAKSDNLGVIPKVDLEFALKSIQSFTDISENELEIIYQAATQHEAIRHLKPQDIILGHYYLHGKNNGNGVIRRVIDESGDDKDMIIYKVITGSDRKKTAATSRDAFALWAKHEVVYKDKRWSLK